MGLFDRFKRRVKEVSDEVDTEELTVAEDSAEGQEITASKTQNQFPIQDNLSKKPEEADDFEIETDDDDWEVFDEDDEGMTQQNQDTDDDSN